MKTLKTKLGFYLAATAVAVLASTTAIGSSPKDKPEKAAVWPPDTEKDRISAAFAAVLTRAAKKGEDAFRTDLKTSSDTAKKALQAQLDACYGAGTIKLPDALLVMFYETVFPVIDDCASAKKSKAKMMGEADGLILVFNLPPVDDKTHYYGKHFRCCYPVWAPKIDPCKQ